MKNLVSLTIFILFLSMTPASFAQNFGVKAGLNLSGMMIKQSDFFSYTDSYKMKTGFHIGPIVEIKVFDFLSMESGIILNSKGYTGISEETINNETQELKDKKSLLFIDVPLTIKVPFSIGNSNFFGTAGGYAGMGLTGDNKISSYYGNNITKIKWGSEEGSDDLKQFDYGLTLGAGINLDPFRIGISYNMGLANLSPESSSGSELGNKVLGISLSYIFGRAVKPVEEKPEVPALKQPKAPKVRLAGRKKAEMEAERIRIEKIRTDSISAVAAEQERIRQEKVRADSIESARVLTEKAEAERISLAKLKADSIATAKKTTTLKPAKDGIVYRVQFASSTTRKGSYNITVGGKNYKTREYLYSGAYRSTVGEFKTLAEAVALQNLIRKSGFAQAFVVAFINDKRSTDPALFR
jgi:hypothetical protein